jgi:hypothetical protein
LIFTVAGLAIGSGPDCAKKKSGRGRFKSRVPMTNATDSVNRRSTVTAR